MSAAEAQGSSQPISDITGLSVAGHSAPLGSSTDTLSENGCPAPGSTFSPRIYTIYHTLIFKGCVLNPWFNPYVVKPSGARHKALNLT